MALFETAQKIRKAYPRMDEGDKVLDTNVQLIPLKFKCKGNPFGINLTYYPAPLTVQYGNVRHHGTHFKLSCKFKGEKEILKVKAQAAAQACNVILFCIEEHCWYAILSNKLVSVTVYAFLSYLVIWYQFPSAPVSHDTTLSIYVWWFSSK